jgi:hypothetical protein
LGTKAGSKIVARNYYDYGHEQLMRSLQYLIIGAGTVAERLKKVDDDHLIHIVPEKDLPKNLRDQFEELRRRLSRGNMSDADVSRSIDDVTDLYVGISTYRDRAARRKARSS